MASHLAIPLTLMSRCQWNVIDIMLDGLTKSMARQFLLVRVHTVNFWSAQHLLCICKTPVQNNKIFQLIVIKPKQSKSFLQRVKNPLLIVLGIYDMEKQGWNWLWKNNQRPNLVHHTGNHNIHNFYRKCLWIWIEIVCSKLCKNLFWHVHTDLGPAWYCTL